MEAKVDDRLGEFYDRVKETGRTNVEQSLIQNQGMDKLFTRCLELMMETEQRIMQANKDMNVENSREIQNFLRNEAANKEQLKIMEERM